MQKIYLLLRNNKQSGPHSLEELLSLNLKHADLVWVEGRSMGWAFPAEIDSLRPFLTDAQVETGFSKTNYTETTLPVNGLANPEEADRKPDMEEKAEALRNRTLKQEHGAEILKKNYVKSLDEIENDYALWVIRNHKKKKRLSGKKMAVAAIVLVGSVGGWVMADMAFRNTKPVTKKVDQAVVSNVVAVQEEMKVAGIDFLNQSPGNDIKPAASKPGNKKPVTPAKTFKETSVIKPTSDTATRLSAIAAMQENAPTEENRDTAATAKKLSLKEKIGNWLKGGKELNKTVQPSEEKALIDITGEIELKVLQDPTYWMMGVKGNKLVVSNKSENNLHAASVELLYYSEENTLIEKKKLAVSGLASGKSKTMVIPDHKLADHVEARLERAKGE